MMAGVDMVHVPYRGSFLPDLLGGQVQVTFDPIPAVDRVHPSGQTARPCGHHRDALGGLPDIPTVGEFVPGYEASGWDGIGAPKNTPAEIIDKLNQEINAVLADPKMKARLADLGAVPMPMTPAEFGKFIAAETEKWGKVIRAANIKAG